MTCENGRDLWETPGGAINASAKVYVHKPVIAAVPVIMVAGQRWLQPNHLERQFDVTEPNKVWVTDITYIRNP